MEIKAHGNRIRIVHRKQPFPGRHVVQKQSKRKAGIPIHFQSYTGNPPESIQRTFPVLPGRSRAESAGQFRLPSALQSKRRRILQLSNQER